MNTHEHHHPSHDASPSPASSERKKSALAHGISLLGFIIPFANVVAPLLVYVSAQSSEKIVEKNCKESLNFQINVLIYTAIAALLCFILVGFILLPLLFLFALIMPIVATVQTLDGKDYRYPLVYHRFLK